MGRPAARIGDQTATGDTILGPGVPTVLIAGQPASVVGDTASGPVFAGAISVGSMTVLIGGRPAAVMGSVLAGNNVQTGVPLSTTVVKGAPTVLFGG